MEEEKEVVVHLTNKEVATVLVALRLFQVTYKGNVAKAAIQWDHFEEVQPLTDEEIDLLCETINTAPLAYD